MADGLQKVNPLVEGQGKLVEIVVDSRAKLDEVKSTVVRIDNTVNGQTNSIQKLKTTVDRIDNTVAKHLPNPFSNRFYRYFSQTS
ncbi:hypothetical protein GCM10028805_18750 [Spirosoma harenae]